MKLEICANSLASAKAAEAGGADRVELCDNMAEGGTAPSPGTILKTREAIDISLYPIVRPRGGDFLYSEDEFQIMLEDIQFCKTAGCEGVVIGVLNADGTIDKERTKKLVEAAYPMGVTFHRAFDRCRNPFQALEEIIDCGCERILTSGQEPTAPQGITLLKSLVEKSEDRIVIMPGAGVRPENLTELIQKTHAREYHSTAKTKRNSQMTYENKLTQKEENIITATDERIVAELSQILSQNIL